MLKEIAEEYRLRLKSRDGEQLLAGRKGHLWGDGRRLMVCFTDEGRKQPFTKRAKSTAMAALKGLRLTQEGDAEFCGEIPRSKEAIKAAIKALGLYRLRPDAGVARPFRKV